MSESQNGQMTIIALEQETLADLYKDLLLSSGFNVIGATHGSELLAGVRYQRPGLIISGLNIIKQFLPAYKWALQNAFKEDGVPMLFITAASACRIEQDIPKTPRVRVLKKPCGSDLIERAVKDFIGGGPWR